MPVSVCNGNSTCLHEDCGDQEAECLAEESDPSGRYIRYKEVLGRGAFKTVYRGFDELLGIEVAWNQVKLQDILRCPEDLERLCAEVHLLKTLKHRNIIKFHHSWVDNKAHRINFITELFTSGTLRQYRKKHKHVDVKAVKNWCRQILRGLLYLHSHDPPIIHRDLKCDNVFINGNHGEVKIGDLGLAAILCQRHAAHAIIGTPEFMAPELYEEEYNELVDIYSFGMCLLEMVTSEYPYSECDSAAQIYKKVSLGIKPAALDKLNNMELRHFVEKCIDTASRRLPARELLMDPFLQYDKDPNAVDFQSALSRNTSESQDMEDFGTLLHEASLKLLHFDTETNLLSRSNSLTSWPPAIGASIRRENVLPKNPIRRLTSLDSKQEKPSRNMDFKVKGKKRENEIVFLRLRISAEGNVRVIHFPFDVEADTAMCVASEMVEELDLTDQDVIKIAEMIDAAVLVMVPEWKPGVAIDDRCDGEELSSKDQEHSSMVWGSDASTLSSDSSFIEPLQQVSHSRHDSGGGNAKGFAGPTQSGSSVYGRFEEVMYHRRLEHGNHEEELHTATTQSSEDAGDDWEQTSSSDSSPVCPGESYTLDDIERREVACTSHGLWQSMNKQLDCLTSSDSLYDKVMDSWGLLQNDFDGDGNCEDSELLMQEVKNLSLKYQQELKELHDKHERALLELRKQWQGKRVVTCGEAGPKYGSSMSTDGADDGHKEVLDAQQHRRRSERDWRKNRFSTTKVMEPPGRLSFEELASLSATVGPPDDLNCPKVSLKEPLSLKDSVNTPRDPVFSTIKS